jgi:hypothetical protein
MTPQRPIAFSWDGEVMKPLHSRIADREYVVGEKYTLVGYEERSSASHRHEFAWLAEAWASLPETMAERFPTSEHLRKWALIRAGYSHSNTLLCKSRAEAVRVAAFLRPMDEFAVIIVQGMALTRYVAMSQSKRAMGAKDFYQSKEKIIEIIAGLIGVDPQTLKGVQAAA